MKLWDKGAVLVNGKLAESCPNCSVEEGKKKTIAYSILQKHNTNDDPSKLKV